MVGKILVIALAMFRLEELAFVHLIICEGGDRLTASESFGLVGFKVIEVFQETVNPDFKDTFDSDKTIRVLLVLEEFAAV